MPSKKHSSVKFALFFCFHLVKNSWEQSIFDSLYGGALCSLENFSIGDMLAPLDFGETLQWSLMVDL